MTSRRLPPKHGGYRAQPSSTGSDLVHSLRRPRGGRAEDLSRARLRTAPRTTPERAWHG